MTSIRSTFAPGTRVCWTAGINGSAQSFRGVVESVDCYGYDGSPYLKVRSDSGERWELHPRAVELEPQ